VEKLEAFLRQQNDVMEEQYRLQSKQMDNVYFVVHTLFAVDIQTAKTSSKSPLISCRGKAPNKLTEILSLKIGYKF
jgi:hypothetical protein